MAKPIFIVRVPAAANRQMNNIQDYCNEYLPDYHAFTVPGKGKYMEFECFNAENIPEIEIEELKKKVLEQFKENQL